MAEKGREEPPYQGGAQPVPQRREEMPGPGRSAAQTIIIILAGLALVAAILWILVPLGS